MCNLLFVHDSKHLRPLQNGGDTESGREVELDKKRLREGGKKGQREKGMEKQDDNKRGSDFTDAYFINHVNKSW